MKEELYQNHGDHIEAIMPTSEFMKNHLQKIISESKLYKKIRTEVTAEEQKSLRTDVFSLISENRFMNLLTLIAYWPDSESNLFMSIYPLLKGKRTTVKIEKVIEWDNQIEATIKCSVGDFEFAFFATDYYENKRAYIVGDEISVDLAALGYKVQAATRGFSFEGQQAVDWLAKIGKEPEYDSEGRIKPVNFSTEKLVAFLNHDPKCPDEAEFQSPIHNIEFANLLGIDFYSTDISIYRPNDDEDISVPLYFRTDMIHNVSVEDPIRGWLWMVGQFHF